MDKKNQKQISVRGIAQFESVSEIVRGFNRHLHYTMVKDRNIASMRDYYFGLAHCVKDHLASRWIRTHQKFFETHPKRVYYLSLEYNIGRSLQNAIINLGIENACDEAMYQIGLDIEELCEFEGDAGLGNGGVGRLAACYLDSMATVGIAGYGYGIRYEVGTFGQKICDGNQKEELDAWLRYGNPWEKARPEYIAPVHFYGKVIDTPQGKQWTQTQTIYALPYDSPVPGYENNIVNTMRLWSAKSPVEFNFDLFNNGDYIEAILDRCLAENITRVLYPTMHNDFVGQELRLKQEYFLCAASIQDIIRRFAASAGIYRSNGRTDYSKFPDKVAIHLNESHAALIIPELMRIFIDISHLAWDEAWDLTTRTCSFTNHQVFYEDLETWPMSMLESLLPRHTQIILKINELHMNTIARQFPKNLEQFEDTSCVDARKRINMAKLAVIGSHMVNGVSKKHTEILKQKLFKHSYELTPEKFCNVTNGITPRRWLLLCNPGLSEIIFERIGDQWPIHFEQLTELKKWAKDSSFQHFVTKVKQENKMKLAEYIEKTCGVTVNVASIFDVHVKPFENSKRQLLNCLHIITLYDKIKAAGRRLNQIPRTIIIAGKASPGDHLQKQIIKLICSVATIVNNDPFVDDQLKVVFLENYRVSLAEHLIPAADVSQHLSLVGTEASATSNMKFALNGALLLATVDGANSEIIEHIGTENMFLFGMNMDQVDKLRSDGYDPMAFYKKSVELRQCIDQIQNGFFSPNDANEFKTIADDLRKEDASFVLADYGDYIRAQNEVAQLFENKKLWNEKVIRGIASCGHFSSDQSIIEYAKKIWRVEPSWEKLSPPAAEPTKN